MDEFISIYQGALAKQEPRGARVADISNSYLLSPCETFLIPAGSRYGIYQYWDGMPCRAALVVTALGTASEIY
jgi:hypothetical protein